MTAAPNELLLAEPGESWRHAFTVAWDIFSQPFNGDAGAAVLERERKIADLELTLSGAAWELWRDFTTAAPRASTGIIDFWQQTVGGKAVLILDALSLREVPWFIAGAAQHGFTIQCAEPRATELPSDTTTFAKALGFASRSKLQSNGASSPQLPGARTDTHDLPWASATTSLQSAPAVVLWHHCLDNLLHANSGAGDTLKTITQKARDHFTSAEFWTFLGQLAKGRTLLITSDHGYAAAGTFGDVSDKAQADWLRETFKSQRFVAGDGEENPFLPPLALKLDTASGPYRFALGRRRWKNAAGYPTLAHGGLSLLEVAVPFIVLTKP